MLHMLTATKKKRSIMPEVGMEIPQIIIDQLKTEIQAFIKESNYLINTESDDGERSFGMLEVDSDSLSLWVPDPSEVILIPTWVSLLCVCLNYVFYILV